MRNHFSKERTKSERYGAGASETAEWPLLKHLCFLQRVVRKRKTFGNLDDAESSCSRASETGASTSLAQEDLEMGPLEATEESSVEALISDEVRSPATPQGQSRSQRASMSPASSRQPEASSVETAVGIFRDCVASRNARETEEDFCLSLCADLRRMSVRKRNLCKMDILKVMAQYGDDAEDL